MKLARAAGSRNSRRSLVRCAESAVHSDGQGMRSNCPGSCCRRRSLPRIRDRWAATRGHQRRSVHIGLHDVGTLPLHREAHLAHIAQVARAAGREKPEVAQKFVFRPGTTTYVAFQTTARAFLAEASAELRRLADEVVQGVRVLDRFNRVRFRGTPEVLAAWRSVSTWLLRRVGRPRLRLGPGREMPRRTGARFGRQHERRSSVHAGKAPPGVHASVALFATSELYLCKMLAPSSPCSP